MREPFVILDGGIEGRKVGIGVYKAKCKRKRERRKSRRSSCDE